ncbi:hypothetical protein ACCAA_20022 [Candidatus Accumulibacter aalborgensis]|uniref:Uncharacterized protein n=1 Tax=Candidatus Accumulibacter aalborgensis TaxID=1860102 RepID=A0A1A8XIC3_9PROT|nr:hypothetical protein ACCAA_20022 [Candidatus Accumulibacter aalborgensis]
MAAEPRGWRLRAGSGDCQAVLVVVRRQVPPQGDLDLGAHPAAQQSGQINWPALTLHSRFPFLSWHSGHFISGYLLCVQLKSSSLGQPGPCRHRERLPTSARRGRGWRMGAPGVPLG